MPNILSKIIKHPATAISGATIAAAGTGVAGYKVGKRRGAEGMATRMASAFSEANQIENQQLARHFFHKGLQHKLTKESSMDKQAALQDIYNEAFNDEIEKIAKIPGTASVMKALKSAWGGVKGTAKGVAGAYAKSAKGLVGGASIASKAKKGALVLGTAGGLGAGAAGSVMLAGRKKD